MNKQSSPLPPWLIVILAFVAIGPPSATLVTSLPTITHNPLLAGALLIGYEIAVALFTLATTYLRKVWERRGDAWADAGIGRLEYAIRASFAHYGHRYAEFFYELHRDLDMKGITIRGAFTLELEQVFVDVALAPIPPELASTDPLRLPQVPQVLQVGNPTLWDYLLLYNRHLVLLGAPGSGKTTLLKHIGLMLVHRKLPHRSDKRRFPWKVPILLALRDYQEDVKKAPESYNLLSALGQQLATWQHSIELDWMKRQLQRGQCLILLDGLDEIADPNGRQQMVTWVERQMRTYHQNGFVLTSRPLGYRSNPLRVVDILETQPFSLEKVTTFVHAWYTASEIKSTMRDSPGVRIRAQQGAEDLLQRLRETPALFALAANPLLLTMIATVHLYHGTLPGARVTLYKAICEVFLNRRQQDPRGAQELRAEQRQLVLQPLAYTMMQQGKREISKAEACQIIEEPLRRVSLSLTPEDFLTQLETISSGLLLEREQGVYGFAHLTFQEYLTMIYLQENHREQELLSHIEESWWHETIRLYAAQADATSIVKTYLAQSSLSLEALTLAIDCAEEARDIQAEVRDQLYTFLEQGVEDADPERRKVNAEALLNRRLRQMRPLQGRTYLDTSLITCAEYQLFIDEQHTKGHDHRPDWWKEETFPASQGRDPILGVRFLDAEAFCQWLTERNREGWLYRLPQEKERQHVQEIVGTVLPSDTGYWIEHANVLWSQTGPSVTLQDQVLAGLIRALDLDIDLDLIRDLASDRDRDLDRALARALYRDRDLARNLASDLARNLASDLYRALYRDLALALYRDLTHARNLASDLASDLARALTRASDLARASDRDLARALARALTDTFEIYLIIYLFLQRPQGHLPAYEGILLVREQISENPAESEN